MCGRPPAAIRTRWPYERRFRCHRTVFPNRPAADVVPGRAGVSAGDGTDPGLWAQLLSAAAAADVAPVGVRRRVAVPERAAAVVLVQVVGVGVYQRRRRFGGA